MASATKTATQIVGFIVVVILAGLLIAFVGGLGPFHRGPSAAAKLQPKVEKSVATTEDEIGAATNEAAVQYDAGAKATDEAMKEGADELRKQPNVVYRDVPGPTRTVRVKVPGPAPDVPDDVWYRRMCGFQHYAGNPNCSRDGG